VRRVAQLLLAAVVVASCGPGGQDSETTVVFAASSLVDVLNDLSNDGESAFVHAVMSFASSASLSAQVADGAPVGLFVSADRQQIDELVASGFGMSDPQVVARNSLVIAVETGNPLGIQTLDDLTRSDLLLAVAAPGVPLGEYSEAMLIAAGVQVSPVTFEADARAVLGKVALGEVDAGIVYATDAMSTTDVDAVHIPEADSVAIEYVALEITTAPGHANELLSELLGERGQQVLLERGFVLP